MSDAALMKEFLATLLKKLNKQTEENAVATRGLLKERARKTEAAVTAQVASAVDRIEKKTAADTARLEASIKELRSQVPRRWRSKSLWLALAAVVLSSLVTSATVHLIPFLTSAARENQRVGAMVLDRRAEMTDAEKIALDKLLFRESNATSPQGPTPKQDERPKSKKKR